MKPRKLPSGSWNVRIMCNGKSYSFTDPDKHRVMRKASEFAEMCHEDMENPKLADAIDAFISERSDSLSPATIRGYSSIARTVRARSPQVANKRCLSLTDRDIQSIIKPISSPKTQRNYVNLIQTVTGRKFSVRYKQKQPKEIQVPSELEVQGLIAIFRKTELEIPVLLGAYAGLRRGEIAALTIQDLDGDYLHISKDMVLDDFGEWITKAPKTLASNRTVLLPHYVAERIRQKGYITHLAPNNITKRFIKRQQSLGIESPYTFHSLRHFFASFLHAQSIPDAYVLRAGGWTTPFVMERVYRHALDDIHLEMSQKAVSAFQNSFQPN